MTTDVAGDVHERFAKLERRQRRSTRWLIVLGVAVLLQTAAIAYLVVPFGGPAKHLVTLQAGRVQVVDPAGTVRAKLTADPWQTTLSMYDAKGMTRVLLRENDAGFVTLEFFDRNSNRKAMTLFTGTERSLLELHDPKTGRRLDLQAAQEGMGLVEFDDRGRLLP